MDELNRLSVEDFKEVEKNPIVLILDNVRSLNNVGAAFRTSDAFLVKKFSFVALQVNLHIGKFKKQL